MTSLQKQAFQTVAFLKQRYTKSTLTCTTAMSKIRILSLLRQKLPKSKKRKFNQIQCTSDVQFGNDQNQCEDSYSVMFSRCTRPRPQLSSLSLTCILTKHTHIMQGLSVMNGIWRTSPSFSHFATDPEMKMEVFLNLNLD